MWWLTKCRLFWATLRGCRGFRPAPQHLRSLAFSGVEAPRWNDQDRPTEFNFANDVLDYWTQMEEEGKRPQSPALWWVNEQGREVKWSFRELTDLSRRTANVLTMACGLKQGDPLALILPRVPEWWLVSIACIRTGIIFMPGTTQLKAKDILYRLQKSKARGIVTIDTIASEVDSVASECPALKTKLLVSDHSREGWLDFWSLIKSASPDHTCIKSKTQDPMLILFTSGTTGFPKMAKHNHGLAFRSSVHSWKLQELKASDVTWCLSDPGWILAVLGGLIEPWTAGSTVFIHALTQFDPKVIVQEMKASNKTTLNPLFLLTMGGAMLLCVHGKKDLQTLFKYPITHCFAATSVFRMVLQVKCASLRFPTLKQCLTGGEAVLLEEQEQWRQQTGVQLQQVYGQSETGITCGTLRGMKNKPGSMGKAIPPYDIQIIDGKGNVLPPNTEGNMGIRIKPTKPLGIFMCYENDPGKTAEVECGDFYNTGDRATMDEEGYIWFLGRGDDVINASGYRIGPAEVENALAEHPAVAESGVVSSPDPTRGEVVKAFVVLTPQFLSHDRTQLTKELQEHVKSVTAPYKYPRKVEFVTELPKTITGKIKRSDLRRKEWGQK